MENICLNISGFPELLFAPGIPMQFASSGFLQQLQQIVSVEWLNWLGLSGWVIAQAADWLLKLQ